jgi:nucleotide-binding universal stress UspA family protein
VASARALALAIEVAREHAAPLTVLHVIEALSEEEMENLPPIGVREHVEALTRRARERLYAAVPREAHATVRISEVVRYGRASHAILREADGCGADLLVLGAQGHRGLGLLGLGSVTDTVVRRARSPVLTTR